MPTREDLQRAIEEGRKRGQAKPPVAAAATPEQGLTDKQMKVIDKWKEIGGRGKKPKKLNPRSAAARDARTAIKGRLPERTKFEASFAAGRWRAEMSLSDAAGNIVMFFQHSSEGLFRCLEELDVQFWEWFTTAPAELKARLVFDSVDHKPEPYPKPQAKEKP